MSSSLHVTLPYDIVLHDSWKKTPWHIHQRWIQNFQPQAIVSLHTVLASHRQADQSEIKGSISINLVLFPSLDFHVVIVN